MTPITNGKEEGIADAFIRHLGSIVYLRGKKGICNSAGIIKSSG
jgi:hypothetical protein